MEVEGGGKEKFVNKWEWMAISIIHGGGGEREEGEKQVPTQCCTVTFSTCCDQVWL